MDSLPLRYYKTCKILYIAVMVRVFGFPFITGLAEKLYKTLCTLSIIKTTYLCQKLLGVVFSKNAGDTPFIKIYLMFCEMLS